MSSRASVIIRSRNERATIQRSLMLLRRQTVSAEIVVVDSGSTDGTLEIAHSLADRVIAIPRERFTYGYALNIGAQAASGPVHFAVSAHCFVEREDWIERSLGHYERSDVAGTCGARDLPDGTVLSHIFHQDLAFARKHPEWGFSNHASSWRAELWRRFPFDERLDYAEDKEWALRVLEGGYVIAVDPALWVDLSHGWKRGTLEFYRRQKRASRALASFSSLPPFGMRELVHEWWSQFPDERYPAWLWRLHYRRLAGLAGKYAGLRAARRSGAA